MNRSQIESARGASNGVSSSLIELLLATLEPVRKLLALRGHLKLYFNLKAIPRFTKQLPEVIR